VTGGPAWQVIRERAGEESVTATYNSRLRATIHARACTTIALLGTLTGLPTLDEYSVHPVDTTNPAATVDETRWCEHCNTDLHHPDGPRHDVYCPHHTGDPR
jgi:hypothetical protein